VAPEPATPEPATPASTDAPASPRAAVAETARPARAEAASRAIEAAPAPAPPVAQPAAQPVAEPGGPRPAEALLQHWDGLRHGRARPRVEELDDTAVARAWPNSFLLRVGGTPEQPRLEPAKTFGGSGPNGNATAHIDATAIDWMVALGREVARDGRPLHEADDLPTPAGDREHGVVALPFGDPAGAVDHVLCHIYPRDAAPAAPAAPPPPQATRTPPPPQVRRFRPGQLFGRR